MCKYLFNIGRAAVVVDLELVSIRGLLFAFKDKCHKSFSRWHRLKQIEIGGQKAD